MAISLGRYVYGLAAVASGISALAWHDFSNWHQIKGLEDASLRAIPHLRRCRHRNPRGVAVACRERSRAGAVALATVYCVFALLTPPGDLPNIRSCTIALGNFFEHSHWRPER